METNKTIRNCMPVQNEGRKLIWCGLNTPSQIFTEKIKFGRDIEGEMCYNHKRNIQVMKV